MQEHQEQSFLNQTLQEETINIREEVEKYLFYWKWFVLTGVIALSLAFVYLRYTTPTYTATASIMIKDNQKSGISAELAAFEDLGIIGGGSANNPENEIQILKSRKIIGQVVDSLDLSVAYFQEGRIKSSEVYEQKPLLFGILEGNPLYTEKDTSFVISVVNANEAELKNRDNELLIKAPLNTFQKSKLGTYQIQSNWETTPEFPLEVIVSLTHRNEVIDGLIKRISISPVDKNSSVLILSLTSNVPAKAEDILNELVKQYNLDAIQDKNLVSEKTKRFIEERLETVGGFLALAQDDVKDYKTKYGITGLSTEGQLALEAVSENNQQIVAIKSQLSLANWIQEKLTKEAADNDVLPTNLGFQDASITSSIESYNELVLLKNKLLVTAGSKNPQLIQIQRELSTLNKNLLSSLANLKKSLEIQLSQLQQEAQKTNRKIATIPLIERGMIDIERQKEIYSELYSYLLTKKEETAISLAVTVPNAKIIDYAYSNGIPVSPKKKIVYLAALLLGLLIPFVFIYVKNLLDTKIHSRKDIETLTSIPFLGDVPHSENDEKIVIRKDARTSTAEAFRLMRTNLGFMLPDSPNADGKTIFVTSTTSGEGKSFISINLAAALSLSNKKVLLLGVDLRAPKVTEYLGIPERKGITNYIMDPTVETKDITFSIPEINDLDIIASGVIPPNPAELLLTSRVKELFDTVKQEYDYIIVDTAPVNLVTDTLLISKYADLTLYVSRANYLDKRLLNVAQNFYQEKKLKNMAIVLNDTDMKRGYGYGYGYGYGAGYLEEVKKPWYKRIF